MADQRSHAEDTQAGMVGTLYANSYHDLFAYLLRRLSDRSDAHDLAQEAYLRLLRVERAELIEHPKAYLFRIASNLVYEFRMKQHRSGVRYARPLEEIDEQTVPSDPERELERRAAIRYLEQVFEDQPPLYRAVLLMRKRDGMSHTEIAEKLDVSVHTVRKYLTRAVAECRKTGCMD